MARGRFDNLEPEKQEAILSAAAAEFAERGYEAASLNRIAERSGTSQGSLYYYLENKADLFATVVERAGAKAAGADASWVEALMGMGEGAKRWMLGHCDQWTDRESAELLDAYVDLLRDMLDAAHEGWDR